MAELEAEVSRAYVSGFIVGLALLVVAGVLGYQSRQNELEEREYRAELADATPVELGVLTESQRAHGRLFSQYRQIRGETILDSIAQAKGKTKVLTIVIFIGLESVEEPQTPESYFGHIARESDGIIRGRVARKNSYITEDGGFILTDYDVEVLEVLKNNIAAPTKSGETITITRPEGKVLLDGMVVKVDNQYHIPLPKADKEVVMFLQYIAKTGAYRMTRPVGAFELNGSVLQPLSKAPLPPGVLQDVSSFLRTARAVAKQ